MQTDRYTKVILTIIAAALVGLLFQGGVRQADAQASSVTKVAVCDVSGSRCADVTYYDPKNPPSVEKLMRPVIYLESGH